MSFAAWFNELNRRMVVEHYHEVNQTSTLVTRLYDAAFIVDEAITVLHEQWAIDANLFANKLLEQVSQSLQYTVWDDLMVKTPAHQPNMMNLCFDVCNYYVVNSDSEVVQIIVKDTCNNA